MKQTTMNTLQQTTATFETTHFRTYRLTGEDYQNIRTLSEECKAIALAEGMPNSAWNALLAQALQKNTAIPVSLITGNLSINGELLFSNGATHPPHTWVEVPGLILDASILSTVFHGTVSTQAQQHVQRKFRSPETTIIATPLQMNQLGFTYQS